MKVHIQNNGDKSHATKVTSVETGEQIYAGRIEMDISGASSHPVTAKITVYEASIDIIADAEIKHVCPHCGRLLEVEKL